MTKICLQRPHLMRIGHSFGLYINSKRFICGTLDIAFVTDYITFSILRIIATDTMQGSEPLRVVSSLSHVHYKTDPSFVVSANWFLTEDNLVFNFLFILQLKSQNGYKTQFLSFIKVLIINLCLCLEFTMSLDESKTFN